MIDRSFTTLSDQPDDLLPIISSCFLDQGLPSNTPFGEFQDKSDLRRYFTYNATLAHNFWLSWAKGYLTIFRAVKNGGPARRTFTQASSYLIGTWKTSLKEELIVRAAFIQCTQRSVMEENLFVVPLLRYWQRAMLEDPTR